MSDKYVIIFFDDLTEEQRTLNGIEEPYEKGWYLVDKSTNIVVGRDGGEPEDQLLIRDWRWVAEALNKEAARAEKAEAILAQLDVLSDTSKLSGFEYKDKTAIKEALRRARAQVEKDLGKGEK